MGQRLVLRSLDWVCGFTACTSRAAFEVVDTASTAGNGSGEVKSLACARHAKVMLSALEKGAAEKAAE